MKSVLQSENECFICGSTQNLQEHHCIHGTANRKKAEKRGLKVKLCIYCHTGSNNAVHRNRAYDLKLIRMAQEYYERCIGSREEFIREFGKSYL